MHQKLKCRSLYSFCTSGTMVPSTNYITYTSISLYLFFLLLSNDELFQFEHAFHILLHRFVRRTCLLFYRLCNVRCECPSFSNLGRSRSGQNYTDPCGIIRTVTTSAPELLATTGKSITFFPFAQRRTSLKDV